MIEVLFPILLGSVVGCFIGILPGIGIVTILALTYPFLYNFNLLELFLFYFSILNASQYYGSIIASAFGLPAELTRFPAVTHGHKLFIDGKGKEAIIGASTGSFIASLFSILLLYIIIVFFSEVFYFFLKGKVILLVLTLVMLISIISSSKKIVSCLFMLLGLFLGYIGLINLSTYTSFATFNISYLDGGIPFYPLMCGLIIIPPILRYKKIKTSKLKLEKVSLSARFKFLVNLKYFPSILRGTVVGFLSGLIPGASYLISSNLAETIEQKFSKTTENIKYLISAESANNAGTVSVLLPLLIIGIPIVASEALILGIAETKGYNVSVAFNFLKNNLHLILLSLIGINLLNWITSGIFYNSVIRFYNIIKDYSYVGVAIVSIMAMLFFAVSEYRLLLSLFVFAISLIIGLIINDERPKFLLLICYFISEIYIDEFYRNFLL